MVKKLKKEDTGEFLQNGVCSNCGREKKYLLLYGDFYYCHFCLRDCIQKLLRSNLEFSTIQQSQYFEMQEKKIKNLERMVEMKNDELKTLESFYGNFTHNLMVQVGELETKLKTKKH